MVDESTVGRPNLEQIGYDICKQIEEDRKLFGEDGARETMEMDLLFFYGMYLEGKASDEQ